MTKKKVTKAKATEVFKGGAKPKVTVSKISAKNITGQKVSFHYMGEGKKRTYVDILPGQVVQLNNIPGVQSALKRFKNSLFIV